MYLFLYSTVLYVHAVLTSGLRILDSPPLNCTQEGLGCRANINNCLDRGWLKPRRFTPTAPQNLTVTLHVRPDENGDLVPALEVNWAAQIDGSIKFLKGTEVHVLEMSINLNSCVRYTFPRMALKKSSLDKAWSFSLDRVLVEPGQQYVVSVNNLPKPNMGHDSYNIFKTITVPGCADARIRKTKKCVESGSLWRSNISLEMSKGQDGEAAIIVGFSGSEFSEKYRVAVQCLHGNREHQPINKSNQTILKAAFALGKWPQTCCSFTVEIQPFFLHCRNDCIRRRTEFNICLISPTVSPRVSVQGPLAAGLGVSCAVVLLCGLVCCRKLRTDPAFPLKDVQDTTSSPRKVLLIYSLDHPLYRDVVLKLCAFLRARCGTEVVLDLLDSAWLSAVGRMQWLDWQKQQIEKSSQKILVLCSRGVRAKWGAMCGGGRVQLREDLRSPMGDMLTPALSLIVPDFVHSSSFQKYMVAYFEDVSSEDDVPAPFNISIKYKLMKHFEELYFRILDQEKHQPGRVKRIQGIAQDEYFNCPSGRALRDAIEAWQAHQLENPDWFEKECVGSEEEVAQSELEHPLLADVCRNPVLQCVPEITEGPPILLNEVELSDEPRGVQALVPLVRPGGSLSRQQVHAGAGLRGSQLCCSRPAVAGGPEVLQWSPRPSVSEEEEEEEEEEVQTSCSPPSEQSLQRLRALQESLGPVAGPALACEGLQDKRLLSQSDQGYVSRSLPQDPLAALSRLQEACLMSSLNQDLPNTSPTRPGPPQHAQDLPNNSPTRPGPPQHAQDLPNTPRTSPTPRQHAQDLPNTSPTRPGPPQHAQDLPRTSPTRPGPPQHAQDLPTRPGPPQHAQDLPNTPRTSPTRPGPPQHLPNTPRTSPTPPQHAQDLPTRPGPPNTPRTSPTRPGPPQHLPNTPRTSPTRPGPPQHLPNTPRTSQHAQDLPNTPRTSPTRPGPPQHAQDLPNTSPTRPGPPQHLPNTPRTSPTRPGPPQDLPNTPRTSPTRPGPPQQAQILSRLRL